MNAVLALTHEELKTRKIVGRVLVGAQGKILADYALDEAGDIWRWENDGASAGPGCWVASKPHDDVRFALVVSWGSGFTVSDAEHDDLVRKVLS